MEKNGHFNLRQDVGDLLSEVEKGEFGDFTNNKYPTPKMALVEKLDEIRKKV